LVKESACAGPAELAVAPFGIALSDGFSGWWKWFVSLRLEGLVDLFPPSWEEGGEQMNLYPNLYRDRLHS